LVRTNQASASVEASSDLGAHLVQVGTEIDAFAAALELVLDLGAREFASKPSDLQEYAEAICGMVRKWAPQKTSVAAEA